MRSLALFAALGTAPALAADYGAPLPADAAPTPLATLLADGEPAVGTEVVASGRIGQVCQKKGCWLMLSDGEHAARVMTRHAFFVPKDARGSAIVAGRLSRYEFDADAAAHFHEDAGGKDRPVEAGAREWRIEARSIRIEAQ